jgi:Ser/Thr protein kinase RdoA (MazF antagonist)
MNAHDETLIANDRMLPGLRTVLDATAFADALRAGDVPFDVRAAKLTYIRYKPGQNCLAGYEIETADGALPVYAKALRADERDVLSKANLRFSRVGKSERGGFVDRDRSLLMTFFPHDAKLRALRRLKSPDDRRRLLMDLFGKKSPLVAGQIETIGYKPERRFVGRIEVEGVPTAVIKGYSDSVYEHIAIRSTALHDAGPLRLAPLIGRADRYRSLAFGWLNGDRLTESILDGRADTRTLYQVGLSLALLHRQSGKGLPARTPHDENRQLIEIAKSLTFLLPLQVAYIDGLVQRVLAGLAREAFVCTPTHGDFYAKQVLIAGDEIQLLDFDECAIDRPLVDVGNFVAHLHRDRLRYDLADGAMETYEEAFLEGYRDNADPVAEEAWNLYAAAGLLKQAPHPFRFREADWPERTLQILAYVEALLEKSARRRSFAPPPETPIDADMPYLEDAMDPGRAGSRFRILTGVDGICVEHTRMIRHKSCRRALIAYDVRLDPASPATETWLGKVRAKGFSRSTYERMRALWDGPFGRSHPAGVSVPEPIGLVAEWNMWLQKQEPGISAAQRLAEPDGIAIAGRIARAIARLHAEGPETDRSHTVEDELRILDERLALLALDRPHWAARLDAVLMECRRLAATLPPPVVRPIHRDFHPENVLIDGERVVLLDLDLYAMGDGAVDAGNFLAHLVEQGLREAERADRLGDLALQFQEVFLTHSEGTTGRSLDIYTILSLARHVQISTLFPDRRGYTETLLALCEERLGLVSHPLSPAIEHVP